MSSSQRFEDQRRVTVLLREIQERANDLQTIIDRNRDRDPFSRVKVSIHKLVGPANSLPGRWQQAMARLKED